MQWIKVTSFSTLQNSPSHAFAPEEATCHNNQCHFPRSAYKYKSTIEHTEFSHVSTKNYNSDGGGDNNSDGDDGQNVLSVTSIILKNKKH